MTNRIAAFVGVLGLSIISLAPFATAQPLADRVPQDVIFYVGWSGAESPGTAYGQSHLKAVLDRSRIPDLFTQFLPQVIETISQKNPEARKPLQTAMALAAPMWKHPTALFVGGIDISNPQQPMPKLGLLCQAGAESAKIKQQIDELLVEMGGQPPVPIETFEKDGLVGLMIGYDDVAKAMAGAGGANGLKNSAAFNEAMKQVQSDPEFIAYVDFEKIVGIIESMVQAQDDPHAKEMVPKALDASGLRGLKRMIHTAGFDGPDWMTMSFLEVPAPRKGMFELLDGRPVSAELIKAIPADATFAAAGRFDAAKFITQLKKVLGEVDPQLPGFVDQGLGVVGSVLAKDLVSDVLEPLGSDWAAYCSPSVAGNGVLGITIVNKLDDPARAQTALPAASMNLSTWVRNMMRSARMDVEIVVRSTKVEDQTVYYIGLPIVAPSWTMKDGYLYLSLYPQTAASAARSTARGGKSILDNEKFAALQKRLAVKQPCAFSFFDLQTTGTQGPMYQQLMLLSRYAGFGDLFGIPLPEPLLPPMEVLQQHLGPAGSAQWIDDAGVHSKSVAPFPGSKLFSEPGMVSGAGVGGSAMMASILLPSLNRARETANRVKCASNMRMMGQAILLYSNEHQGDYPPDLGTLIKTEDVTGNVFVCPSGNVNLPRNWGAMTPDQMAEWINTKSPYVFIGKGLKNDAPADRIVLYERPDDHNNDGINALFGDGHVEFMVMDDARQRLGAQGVQLSGRRK